MTSNANRTFSKDDARRMHAAVARERLTDSLVAWGTAGDVSRYVFLHPWEFWPHHVVYRNGDPREFREAARADVASFPVETPEGGVPLEEYVASSTVDGMVIVHGGAVVFEAYPRMRPADRHLLFSVSKLFVAAVVARLEHAGRIDSHAPVPTYLEPLAESAWDAVRVIDLLDMCSGMDCPIEFGVSGTCFERTYDVYGFPLPKASVTAQENVLPFLASIERARPAGETFEYIDLNTLVLTLLVESVTGRTFADLLEREIWSVIGAESDATIIGAAFGRAVTPMGISATLRDLARFGLAFVPENASGGSRLFDAAALRRIVEGARPELFASSSAQNLFGTNERLRNSYHWGHVTDEGDLFTLGFGGQGLYVSPSRDLVIAFVGTWTSDGTGQRILPAVRRLATSVLFASG